MASYSSSSSSSSLASQSPHPWRYDVFISFRGEDTRRSFTSHLYDALCRKGLLTFIDDNELQRGEEIAPSLVQAIQESNVAVVVFSKDYASSAWCLDELVKINECRQTRRQTVIPVFYDVNPSHIRNQSHNFATAFERHEQNHRNDDKIQNWRVALTSTAKLSGFDSNNFGNDNILISEIVEDISKKLLKSTVFNGDQQLVGVDSHFQQIKQEISFEGQDVCIIGIWGMGGIGKTAIAEFIFRRLSFEFEVCCFLKDVRERSKVKDLRKELISQLLGEKEPNVYAFPKTRFGRRRALIVLDDVDDSQQLDSLIGDPCWFGSQSIIIITGRDQQVFGRRTAFLYEVEPLKDEEALQLFSWSAFKQNNPRNDYESLSSSIVEYAQGNPLALKVLGSSLSGKTTKEWESALKKLSKCPNKNIQDVLQIGYDRLDGMEKDIFLHIACFFKGENKDVIMRVFESCGFDADIIVSVLVDKYFVTISGNILEMHDLMQEMGKEIVRQESKHPNERSRLWDPKDVFKVLAEDKATEAVESIMLDVSKIQEIYLNPKVFMKTPNLKFLKFYMPDRCSWFEEQSNLRLSQGLDYLPNELTYFHWDGYPLESFPSNFRPNHLIVLELPNSKIKQFQKEVKDENIGYSVASQLSCGKFGTILHRVCSLIKIPSYIHGWQLGKVTSLSLTDCKNISHLPNSRVGFLEALENLNLYGCKNLNTFPEVSRNIKSMLLMSTAIKQIPSSSVEHLGKLEKLNMNNCKNLESLPSNFFNALTSLKALTLDFCPRLNKLPQIPKIMSSLETLRLGGTDLEIPSSIGNLQGLKRLQISGCPKLTFVRESVVNLTSLNSLNLLGHKSHHPVIDHSFLPWLLEGTSSLKSLHLHRLNLGELPEDLSFLSSVRCLDLSDNNFERIPTTIKQLSNLSKIELRNCQRLISLPELPSSVTELKVVNCTSLEQIRALKQLILESKGIEKRFCFWNCLKLDEDECQEVAHLLSKNHKPGEEYHMHYPGSRIPEWVKYRSMGDSVEVPIPSHWLNRDMLRVALCVCVKSLTKGLDHRYLYRHGDLCVKCDCYFGDNYHAAFEDTMICQHGSENAIKEHVVVIFHDISCDWMDGHDYSLGDVALFKFSLNYCGGGMKILNCGVTPLYSHSE